MAVSNTQNFMSTRRVPSEPRPLPSLSSDEESFVVLGHSLSQDVDIPQSEELFEPVGSSVIEEAKQLINSELLAMEQLSLKSEETSLPTGGVWGGTGERVKEEEEASPKTPTPVRSLEQSAITLPEMPRVEKDFDSSNNMISIAAFSTELCPEEVQAQISHIIEENVHLKDVLIQNNKSMKSQIERIVAWQEDVQKVHEAHKQKLIEAKDFIERLKKENINSNIELENMREVIHAKEKDISALKAALQDKERKCNEKLAQSTSDNMKAFELDVANKKMKELESAVKNLNAENAKLKADNSKLEKDLKQNENSKAKLVDFEAARKQIEEIMLGTVLHSQAQQFVLNLCEYFERERAHGGPILPLSSVQELKTALATVQSLATEKEQALSADICKLQAKLPQAEEVANARQQLASIQMSLTQTEYSRAAAYAQISSKNEQLKDLSKEIFELRHKIDDLNARNQDLQDKAASQDDMFALQTQLEVFKADFEAERNAKEVLKGEKEKLVEDLQNLQRRNQQLQEEIEMVRDNRDYVVYPPNRSERPTRNSPSAPSGNEHFLKCPKCNFGFTTMQALENHVYRCIELDDHLP